MNAGKKGRTIGNEGVDKKEERRGGERGDSVDRDVQRGTRGGLRERGEQFQVRGRVHRGRQQDGA